MKPETPYEQARKHFPSGAGNTNDADPVDFVSAAARRSSTAWDFRIRSIAAPGQQVYMMENNQVAAKVVDCLRIHITKPKEFVRIGFDHKIQYSVLDCNGDNSWVNEDEVFASKADLLASL